MDGIRGYWDGVEMWSRHGKSIPVPDWFVEGFPGVPLDGELWMGRGTFDELITALNSNDQDWKLIEYHAFDLPASNQNYRNRLKQLEQLKHVPSHLKIVENIECNGVQHLNSYLDTILEAGGEGIMVRDPTALYSPGLTQSLLKVKV